jgi:hypothetical protein
MQLLADKVKSTVNRKRPTQHESLDGDGFYEIAFDFSGEFSSEFLIAPKYVGS